jgi:NAD(P)-dependent dehydrogenase (short-subunit alcohol dehydrogenase family)
MKRHVIVIGATGGIGSRVVGVALAAGYRVIAIGRDEAGLRELVAEHESNGGLIALRGSFADEAQAAAVAREIRGLRARIDGVVAAIGGPVNGGRLLERTADALAESFDHNVVPHFLAAKHLLPLLAERNRGASYIVLGCAAADHAWAGYGHVSIGSAARKMLVQVLREECKDVAVRIQLLQIEGQVCTHKNARMACPAWVSADAVGEKVVELLRTSDGQPGVVHLRANPASVHTGDRG